MCQTTMGWKESEQKTLHLKFLPVLSISILALIIFSSNVLGAVTHSGTNQTVGGYIYITCLANCTFNTTDTLTDVSILTIGGGGGGGGSYYAGGGGGGGLKWNSSISLAAGNYNITVGYGGAGGPNSLNGSIGGNSSVTSNGILIVRALGGGGGASSVVGTGTSAPNGTLANGGGASANGGVGGVTTDGGFQGGNSTTGSTGAGGGAGCNGLGSNGVATSKGGDGGIGVNLTSYFPLLTNVQLCGGGGGSASDAVQWGYGVYGGGNGTKDNSGTPADATPGINGTGGGGGGTSRLGTKKGGDGGTGRIIIRYLPPGVITLASEAPLNTTYTSNVTPKFNGTISIISGTWNISLIMNGAIKQTLPYNTTGMFNLTPTSSLNTATEYTWYFNATSGTNTPVVTETRNIYITGAAQNCTVTNGTSCITNIGLAYFRPNNCTTFP